MGRYAEYVEQMHVRVTSPDGNIVGTMDGPTAGEITFAEGSYEDYTERSLERQLSAVAKLFVVGRRRAQREAMEAATGMSPSTEDPSKVDDPRRRRYLQEWDEMTSEGMSPSACVHIAATGMMQFRVTIRDGTLRRMEEDELVSEVRGATEALLQAQRHNARALREEIYDPKAKAR